MNLKELGCGNKDWIELAEGWDRLRALVNVVMNFGFNKMWGIS
jgi:hypothetical protein